MKGMVTRSQLWEEVAMKSVSVTKPKTTTLLFKNSLEINEHWPPSASEGGVNKRSCARAFVQKVVRKGLLLGDA